MRIGLLPGESIARSRDDGVYGVAVEGFARLEFGEETGGGGTEGGTPSEEKVVDARREVGREREGRTIAVGPSRLVVVGAVLDDPSGGGVLLGGGGGASDEAIVAVAVIGDADGAFDVLDAVQGRIPHERPSQFELPYRPLPIGNAREERQDEVLLIHDCDLVPLGAAAAFPLGSLHDGPLLDRRLVLGDLLLHLVPQRLDHAQILVPIEPLGALVAAPRTPLAPSIGVPVQFSQFSYGGNVVVGLIAVGRIGVAVVGESVLEEFRQSPEDVRLVRIGDAPFAAEPQHEIEDGLGRGRVRGGEDLTESEGSRRLLRRRRGG
mmetsp:Transcript_61958/g.183041  ORF Transcript_61958/g.183041 Transcript_61958/m.183041 type:complete len:321 (+) Transcript_61958:178-1140(+)